MLFNSLDFLFIFLPITLLGFYLISRLSKKYVFIWLVICSLFFYGYYEKKYLLIIVFSIVFNYLIGNKIYGNRKILIFGIGVNLFLLGYFKYTNFFLQNSNQFIGTNFSVMKIALPLAISFFTFQQIAYLVDGFKKKMEEKKNFISYSLFILFFPQLIAGPIVHHRDMIPQFLKKNFAFNIDFFTKGVFLFSIGFFKKVVIASYFTKFSMPILFSYKDLGSIEIFLGVLSYAFRIYYDFSAYSEMAMGLGLMFNIKLPLNFNSPYKATNIQEFWRHWHITLSQFLRNYLYIPLGGNRKGFIWMFGFIMITFLIGGFWHGAGIGFITWGFLHGSGFLFLHLYRRYLYWMKIPKVLAWLITFNFVLFTWIFFRLPFKKAIELIIVFFTKLQEIHLTKLIHVKELNLFVFLGIFLLLLCFKNSVDFLKKITWPKTVLITFLFLIALIKILFIIREETFIYFAF